MIVTNIFDTRRELAEKYNPGNPKVVSWLESLNDAELYSVLSTNDEFEQFYTNTIMKDRFGAAQIARFLAYGDDISQKRAVKSVQNDQNLVL